MIHATVNVDGWRFVFYLGGWVLACGILEVKLLGLLCCFRIDEAVCEDAEAVCCLS